MDHHTEKRITRLPGFGPATMVMTPEGEVPVDWLATGDRVLTRDHGAQPILWIGRHRVGAGDIAANPMLAPLWIGAGALGPGCPQHPTALAPLHRVLIDGPLVELNIGVPEGLARITDLADGVHVTDGDAGPVQYTQLLLPCHEVVQANGFWAETLHLDPDALALLAGDLPPDILSSAAVRRGHAFAVRPCLDGWEVAVLRGVGARSVPDLIRQVA